MARSNVPAWVTKALAEDRTAFERPTAGDTRLFVFRRGDFDLRLSVSIDRQMASSFGRYQIMLSSSGLLLKLYGSNHLGGVLGSDSAHAQRALRVVGSMMHTGVRPPRPGPRRGDVGALVQDVRLPLRLALALSPVAHLTWAVVPPSSLESRPYLLVAFEATRAQADDVAAAAGTERGVALGGTVRRPDAVAWLLALPAE